MKQCPVCKTNYTDDTLSFCLSDGQQLVALPDDFPTVVNRTGEPTAVFGQGDKMRVEIPQPVISQPAAAAASVPAPASGGGFKVFIGALAVILVLAAIVVVAGLAIYFGSRGGDVTSKNTVNRTATPTPQPSPTTDDGGELRKQIANLEKRLNEQKNSNRLANIQNTIPNQPTSSITARVNSPSDGFLALRSLPNSEAGERIMKIPHGATVSIGACGPVTRPANRSGRWCQASYNGYSGWVFDAYVTY